MDPKYSIVIFLVLVAAAAIVTFPDGFRSNTELINYNPAPLVDDGSISVDDEKEYVGTLDECSQIDFTCNSGYEKFEDENGCGCV